MDRWTRLNKRTGKKNSKQSTELLELETNSLQIRQLMEWEINYKDCVRVKWCNFDLAQDEIKGIRFSLCSQRNRMVMQIAKNWDVCSNSESYPHIYSEHMLFSHGCTKLKCFALSAPQFCSQKKKKILLSLILKCISCTWSVHCTRLSDPYWIIAFCLLRLNFCSNQIIENGEKYAQYTCQFVWAKKKLLIN